METFPDGDTHSGGDGHHADETVESVRVRLNVARVQIELLFVLIDGLAGHS